MASNTAGADSVATEGFGNSPPPGAEASGTSAAGSGGVEPKSKPPTPKKQRTEERWLMLLTAFREAPANFAKVSARTGFSVAVCKGAWEDGWADTTWGATPISTLIAREHAEAAKKAHEARLAALDGEAARMRAERTAAMTARDEERKAVNLTRANALGMAALSTQALQSGRMLMALIQNIITTLPPTPDSLHLAMKALGSISLFQLRSQQVLRGVLEAERVLTGQPIAVVGAQIETMTPAQIRDSLQGLLGMVRSSVEGIDVREAEVVEDEEPIALDAGEEAPPPITPEALADMLARDNEDMP